MIGMYVSHHERIGVVVAEVTGTVDAVSVMADGLAIARVCDRWIPVDELVAV